MLDVNIDNIIKLQKKYLYNRFIKSYNENKYIVNILNNFSNKLENINMYDYENYREELFNEFKKIMTNKVNLLKINDIFKKYYRYYGKYNEINVRKILSGWLIIYFRKNKNKNK